jgi:hypothetical protein
MTREERDAKILELLDGQDILVIHGKVWNVEETKWRNGDEEGQDYTVYTEPDPEYLAELAKYDDE